MEHFRDYTFTRDLDSGEDWFIFTNSNSKSEKMIVIITHWDNGDKFSLPYNNYLVCRTYVDAPEACTGKYNPQLNGNKANWEWYLEGTPENEQAIIDEVARRFYEEVL